MLSLETIRGCLWETDADDNILRATVSLRLGLLAADFQGDYRKACQVSGFGFSVRHACHVSCTERRSWYGCRGKGSVGWSLHAVARGAVLPPNLTLRTPRGSTSRRRHAGFES